jgi:hypothetical protein
MTNNDTKETWLLLRGLLREQGHWGDFPSQLQQHLPDIKIITLDISGNGLKHLEKSPSSIAGMVDELRCQYKKRRFKTKCNKTGYCGLYVLSSRETSHTRYIIN